jgi:D-beta-D-heptose 7-phosphate kinase/D-beta-D-heptose 1-phosphate adenosyltransferase
VILEEKNLEAWLQDFRQTMDNLVFTNGCFDILHAGHVDYLQKARQLGDALLVGLNNDESVRKLKGDSRPIVDEKARAMVLAALEAVDAVVLFKEETPGRLIDQVQPDVLVKGGEYLAEEIVGYQTVTTKGGTVKVLPFLEGHSTTSIIKKLRSRDDYCHRRSRFHRQQSGQRIEPDGRRKDPDCGSFE